MGEIKEHLNEINHIFKDGSSARLAVSEWNRKTVADGSWQNVNTIRPLSARDVYLAECLDDLVAGTNIYEAGPGITITKVEGTENTYTIAADFNLSLTGSNGIGVTYDAEANTGNLYLSGGSIDASLKLNSLTAQTITGEHGEFDEIYATGISSTNLTATETSSKTVSITGGRNSLDLNGDFEVFTAVGDTKVSLSSVLNRTFNYNQCGGIVIIDFWADSYKEHVNVAYFSPINIPKSDIYTSDTSGFSATRCVRLDDYLDSGYNKFIYRCGHCWKKNNDDFSALNFGVSVNVDKLKPYLKYTFDFVYLNDVINPYGSTYGISFYTSDSETTDSTIFYNVNSALFPKIDGNANDASKAILDNRNISKQGYHPSNFINEDYSIFITDKSTPNCVTLPVICDINPDPNDSLTNYHLSGYNSWAYRLLCSAFGSYLHVSTQKANYGWNSNGTNYNCVNDNEFAYTDLAQYAISWDGSNTGLHNMRSSPSQVKSFSNYIGYLFSAKINVTGHNPQAQSVTSTATFGITATLTGTTKTSAIQSELLAVETPAYITSPVSQSQHVEDLPPFYYNDGKVEFYRGVGHTIYFL